MLDDSGEAVTADLSADDWTTTFSSGGTYTLYKYRDHGTAIEYTVAEDHVAGYTLSENEAVVGDDGT